MFGISTLKVVSVTKKRAMWNNLSLKAVMILHTIKTPLHFSPAPSSPAWLWLHPSLFPSQACYPKNVCDVQMIEKWNREPAGCSLLRPFRAALYIKVSQHRVPKTKKLSSFKKNQIHNYKLENRADQSIKIIQYEVFRYKFRLFWKAPHFILVFVNSTDLPKWCDYTRIGYCAGMWKGVPSGDSLTCSKSSNYGTLANPEQVFLGNVILLTPSQLSECQAPFLPPTSVFLSSLLPWQS